MGGETISRRTVLKWSVAAGAGAVMAALVPPEGALAALTGPAESVTALEPPCLLWCSDAVKPNQSFGVSGEFLDNLSVELALAPAVAAPRSAPPADAVTVGTLQRDKDKHFLTATLPATLAPGVYELWAATSSGWSSSLLLNGPRPLFLSEREAWPGQEVTIVGRNFTPDEYGATGSVQVRLRDGARTIPAHVVRVDPYAIVFTVPSAASGVGYTVQVSAASPAWVDVSGDEPLTIVPAGTDPLGLGVSWAGSFAWQRTFSVTAYGAHPDTGVDVTAGVQAAVDAAKAAGGGIVTLPAGHYEISRIGLPADVVIRGAGPTSTTLVCTAAGGAFIGTTGDGTTKGHHGVADLRIELRDQSVRPDTFIVLAEPWAQNNNVNDMTARTASEVFVSRVDLEYSLSGPPVTQGQRGIGIGMILRERALVSDCNFVGYHAQPYINFITNYYTVRRSYFEYSTGNIVGNGSRVFYQDNTIVGHRDEAAATGDYDLHGFFARDRAYMANNTARGLGSLRRNYGLSNDGESFAVEVPNATFNYGGVLGASSNTLLVDPVQTLTNPTLYFGYLAVLIVDGRGLGQLRAVSAIDPATNQITVSRPWTVVPDTSSVFTLIAPLDQVTFWRNTAIDCTKGMWLFGNTYDSVIADCAGTDTEGAYMWTVRTGTDFIPGYFARMARNSFTGISAKSQHGGVCYNTGRFDRDGAYYGTLVYGMEFRDNRLSGVPGSVGIVDATEAPIFSGIGAIAATYSTLYDGDPAGADGKAVIVAGNHLRNLDTGVTVTHSNYGVLVIDNAYEPSVATFLTDTGSINLLQRNNHPDQPQAADPKLAVNARAQIWSGESYLAVWALNTDTTKLDIRFDTPYGEKEFTAVPPGKAVYNAFRASAAHIPAGTATIAASKVVAGGTYYTTIPAPYDAV